MTQQHPIIPSPELARQWSIEAEQNHQPTVAYSLVTALATHAAQWGADQELEACCQALYDRYDSVRHATGFPGSDMSDWLRAARRPKPPSLKEQALLQLDVLNADLAMHGLGTDLSQIRRALEQLSDHG
jgi:hypothetical protein